MYCDFSQDDWNFSIKQCFESWAFTDFSRIFNIKGRKEMFYLTTHSTHSIYGYMASDIW